ncbi:SymE family type I addiction module toxin [Xenorhabdus budapestensis]|uniref:SymE family type I addiction module toxin n=1 Tax=Xenorhabdus budapestensis TaxID=290110 RepID=UPI003A858D30
MGYVLQNGRPNPPPVIHLKATGFDIGGTLTVKIMDGCLVLIPDSDYTRSIKQQY